MSHIQSPFERLAHADPEQNGWLIQGRDENLGGDFRDDDPMVICPACKAKVYLSGYCNHCAERLPAGLPLLRDK